MPVKDYMERLENDECPECASDDVLPQFPRGEWLHWREWCRTCEWKGELKRR